MRKKRNKIVSLLMIPILLLSMFVQMPQASAETDLGLTVDAAILIDAESGKILYEQNADTSLGIASMTKMMTEYLLLDAIKEETVIMGSTVSCNGVYLQSISRPCIK